MERFAMAPAVAADAAAVAEVLAALELSLYGRAGFAQSDLEDEWSTVDLQHNTQVVRDGDRIVGYAAIHDKGELCRAEGFVHPDVSGCGIGRLIVSWLEQRATLAGARRIQNSVFEADHAGGRLVESLGYRAVRTFRELRIELTAPPPAPAWPDGLRIVPFDPERDAREFHAAREEAFADHWNYRPRDFETWSKNDLESERFDPTLWCVVRAGDEIAAGTVCAGNTYGGGWVHELFTRRGWRKRGVGMALLHDAFGRFWERGEHSIGLGVDTANDTGALRLYERAGMAAVLGQVVYEKELGDERRQKPCTGR